MCYSNTKKETFQSDIVYTAFPISTVFPTVFYTVFSRGAAVMSLF